MKKIVGLLLIACLAFSFIVFMPNIALAFLGWAGANNSPYIPTANTQPYDINVSRNVEQSKKPCIAIDSNDIPHIVWEDNHGTKFGNYDIMYIKWDPTIDNWVGANGSVYDPTVDVPDQPHDINVSQNLKNSITPKIVLDSNDIPHIVWSDYTGNDSDIFYVYWEPGLPSGSNWARADHTLYNGSNADVSLNTGDSCHPSIDLDSNDMPHIVWADTHYGDPEILYVYWDDSMVGQQWVCADGSRYMANGPFCHGNVSDNDGDSIEPVIKIEDGPNYASIAWADNSYTTSRTKNYEILYVSWDGSQWIGANGSAYNPSTGANANVSNNVGDSRAPSLDLGVDPAFPHIAWHDATCTVGINEVLYARYNGANWVGANGGIYNSTTCVNAYVSDSSADSKHPKLVLDSNYVPHLVWYVNTNDGVTDIIYVKWVPANNGWFYPDGQPYTNTNANVSKNTDSSLFPCLGLDSNDEPHLVWEDRTYPKDNVCPEDEPATLDFEPMSLTKKELDFVCEETDEEANVCSTQNGFETMYVHWADFFNGTFEIAKSVDTDDDDIFDDEGDTVYFGTIVEFRIEWIFNNPTGNTLTNAYMYDTIPEGTKFHQGGVPVSDAYSTDGGANWTPGQPPEGSVTGTILRWFIPNGATTATFKFYVEVLSATEPFEVVNFATFSHADDNGIPIETNEVIIYAEEEPDDGGGGGGGGGSGGGGGGQTRPYSINLTKSVDVDGDGFYKDEGRTIDSGTILSYNINWRIDNPDNVPITNGWLYESVPMNMSYYPGGATTSGLQYNLGGGGWQWGEPPIGSTNVNLRWNVSGQWIGASAKAFDPNRSRQPNEINVSLDRSFSEYSQVVIDSKGIPHVCWQDRTSGNYEIYYVRWNETNSHWVGANGSIYDPTSLAQPPDINVSRTPNPSLKPSLQLDTNDLPQITWTDSLFIVAADVYYVKWNDTIDNWVGAGGSLYVPMGPPMLDINISRNPSDSETPVLRLDSNNLPHVVWIDSQTGNQEIHYVKWMTPANNWYGADGFLYTPGAMQPLSINVSRTPRSSLWPAFDLHNNLPCIAWRDLTFDDFGDIYFVRWNTSSANWTGAEGVLYNPLTGSSDVSLTSGYSDHPTLDMDSLGNPHLAWSDLTYSDEPDILYVTFNPFWNKWLGAKGSVYNPIYSWMPMDIEVSRTNGPCVEPCIKTDKNNKSYITWMDYSFAGNYGNSIVFARWDMVLGNWVGADGSPYITGMNHHKNTQGVVVSSQNGFVRHPNLFIGSDGRPHLTWTDNNYGGVYDIMYVTTGVPNEKNFRFRAKAGYVMKLTKTCNQAYFARFYQSETIGQTTGTETKEAISNEVCIFIKPSANQPFIEVIKSAKSMQYREGDFITFGVWVKNTGKLPATQVWMGDRYPPELVFYSSRPTGTGSNQSLRYQIGTLGGGATRYFEITFKLKKGLRIPENGLTLTNYATAYSKELEPVTDLATIFILNDNSDKWQLSLWTAWKGIDTKKSEGKTGQEIELSFKPEGGHGPYVVTVDWGDGTSKFRQEGIEGHNIEKTTHTYDKPGDYNVVINCTDVDMRSMFVRRKITIK